MNAITLAAIMNEQQAAIIEACPMNNEPVMDGTGPHLGLRTPWWNDGIHELTDTTWFRWLMVFVVFHYIYTTWFR